MNRGLEENKGGGGNGRKKLFVSTRRIFLIANERDLSANVFQPVSSATRRYSEKKIQGLCRLILTRYRFKCSAKNEFYNQTCVARIFLQATENHWP